MTTSDNDVLADRLVAAGYFEGLEPEETAELEADFRRHGWSAVFGHPWRSFGVDDESVAEGSAGELLEWMQPAFVKLGAPALKGEELFNDDGSHYMNFPDETLVLYSKEEFDADGLDESRRLRSWGIVPSRLYRFIDAHLARHGRSEQVYCVGGGNDGFILLLTPEMLDAVVAAEPSQIPYLRTEDWPACGWPDAE